MVSSAIALSSTLNLIIIPEKAGHELLPVKEDIILFNFTINDRTTLESRKKRNNKVATPVLNNNLYLSANKESDKRCKHKREADGDLI
jgi:hypothetical protein